jgi:hypothetical protein
MTVQPVARGPADRAVGVNDRVRAARADEVLTAHGGPPTVVQASSMPLLAPLATRNLTNVVGATCLMVEQPELH